MSELDEKTIKVLTDHIDDAWIRSHGSKYKEMSTLMSDLRKDIKQIGDDLKKLASDVQQFNNDLQRVEIKLQNDIEKHELELRAGHSDHERRISDTEKWKSWLAVTVFGAIILGVLKLLGI